ncbi:hypothetical protein H477_2174 [[Clostridium] sordellii ATCC 9714]|nr:hypothetical protein H477_2174 [[Clostridium] sordellii ATCC 9714] [Paeniclostridium sordellii ATCC 9714]
MPSAEVVFVNLNLKFPIVQSKLSKDSDFEEDDVILSVISLSKKKVYDLNDLQNFINKKMKKF